MINIDWIKWPISGGKIPIMNIVAYQWTVEGLTIVKARIGQDTKHGAYLIGIILCCRMT